MDHLLTTLLVDLVVAMVVPEDIVQAELVYVIHLYLAFLAMQRRLLIEDVAIVAKALSGQRADFP